MKLSTGQTREQINDQKKNDQPKIEKTGDKWFHYKMITAMFLFPINQQIIIDLY